jgi:hypothetical protein
MAGEEGEEVVTIGGGFAQLVSLDDESVPLDILEGAPSTLGTLSPSRQMTTR